MDSLLPSLDASAKPTGLSGLLSSLGALLEGSAANPGIFEQFLEQSQLPIASSASDPSQAQAQPSLQPSAEPNDTSTCSANSVANNGQAQNLQNGSLRGTFSIPVLKRVISSAHHILEQLNRSNKTATAQKSAQTNNTRTTPPANGQSQASNPAVQRQSNAGSDPANVAVTASSDSTAAANVSGDAQTLTQLLSQLVALMQMIEKKLEALQAGTGKSSSSLTATGQAQSTAAAQGNVLPDAVPPQTASIPGQTPLMDGSLADNIQTDANPSAAVDLQSSAADPLTQLLGLLQAIEKKLAGSSGDGLSSATATDAAAATDPTIVTPANLALVSKSDLTPIQMPNFSEVEKNLQSVLDALRGAIAQGAGGATSNVSAVNSAGTSNEATSQNQKIDLAQNDNPLLAPLDNLSDLFASKVNALFGGASVADVNAVASGNINLAPDSGAGGKGDGLLGGNAGDNGAGTTAGAQNLVADNPALTALSDGVSSINPYSFASQLSALRAANGGATGLPSAVEQVILQLNRGVKDGNDQMTIQLQPADLGKINIKLDIASDGKVQGTVVADNPSTLNLLLKDVRGLERALQEAGLRADSGSLQFSLGGQSGNTSGQTANNFMSGGSSTGNASSFDTNVPVPDIAADTNEVWYVTPGRVNFKV